jgi:predicted DNA-binding WGR domain protein
LTWSPHLGDASSFPTLKERIMAARRFELVEGSSSKFWQIEIQGAKFTVTFGRIGTAGQSKTTPCASPEVAAREAEKLIREKTKKGYHEHGAEAAWRPPVHVGTNEHLERFLNYKVTDFNPDAEAGEGDDEGGRKALPALRDLDKRVFAVGLSYDDADEDFGKRLDALLADPRIGELRALVIGQWWGEVCEEAPLFDKLGAKADKLGALVGLMVGDVIQEECEISWIHQGDYAPLLKALPKLEHLMVRGGDGLRFSKLAHKALRSLTVQTGGLSAACVQDIAKADLPELRTLVLWLGDENYGGDSTVEDLAGILDGKRFPKLEHLGLQDSPNADAIAAAVAKAPILKQLKGLDLSMGTLSDEGAEALLASPAIRGLKHLNLRHHYMSAKVTKKLHELGIEVNVSERQEAEDEEDRFIEVSE